MQLLLEHALNVTWHRQYYYPTTPGGSGGGARLLPAVDLRRHGIPGVHGQGGNGEQRFYDSRFFERY